MIATATKLSPARRLEILNDLVTAGEDGITMRERKFTPEEIAILADDALVIRTTAGRGRGVGIYRLTDEGANYRTLRLYQGDRRGGAQ